MGGAMARPLSVITPEELKALGVDERLERSKLAEKYRRAGRESNPAVRELHHRILRGAGCQLCGSTDRASVDHIFPIILGGTHAPENLRILCGSCNSRKGARNK